MLSLWCAWMSRGARRGSARVATRRRLRWREHCGQCFCLRVWEFSGFCGRPVRGCTRDRPRGSVGVRTYGVQPARYKHHPASFAQVTGHMEVQAGAYCKTVSSAYVGSNPTPATPWGNGPLAGNSRLCGPFLLCPVMCHLVPLWTAVSRCPRTYSGRRSAARTVGVHRRLSTDGHGRAVPVACSGLTYAAESSVHPRTHGLALRLFAGGGRPGKAGGLMAGLEIRESVTVSATADDYLDNQPAAGLAATTLVRATPAAELMVREPGRPRAGSPDSTEDVSLARTEPLSTTDILAGHFVVACQPCVAHQGCR